MEQPEVLLSEQQIAQKVAEMAAAVSRTYGSETLHVIGLLDNGFIFMADLVRQLTCPTICQFVKLETHDVVEGDHERRLVVYTPHLDVEDRHLLLVDSVLQTGVTLDHLIQQFRAKGAASIRTAVLIDKQDKRRVDLTPDYFGFQMQGKFLVGYGMGFRELHRNLPYVGAVVTQRLAPAATAASDD